MKRLISSTLAVFVMMAMMVLGSATPASAGSGSSCLDYGNRWNGQIRSCISLTWIKQPDGSGVILTSVGHSTPSLCQDLEDSGGKYGYRSASWPTMSYNWGPQGCSSLHGVYQYGNNTGPSTITVWLKARVDNSTDYILSWRIHLYQDGSWYVAEKYPTPVGDCC